MGGRRERTMTQAASGAAGGFTLVEVILAIAVIGILTGIIVLSGSGYTGRARDAERAADIATITRQLERYYRNNPLTTGSTYPPTSTSAASMASIIDNSDAIHAPGGSANSLVMATTNATQSPSVNTYIYQPLTAAGALCTSTPCRRYKLYYRDERTSSIHTLNSMRQQ